MLIIFLALNHFFYFPYSLGIMQDQSKMDGSLCSFLLDYFVESHIIPKVLHTTFMAILVKLKEIVAWWLCTKSCQLRQGTKKNPSWGLHKIVPCQYKMEGSNWWDQKMGCILSCQQGLSSTQRKWMGSILGVLHIKFFRKHSLAFSTRCQVPKHVI